MNTTTLAGLERTLWTAGTVLGLWCGAVLMEARYFSTLPVPPAAAVATLPGENEPGDARPDSPSAGATGSWVGRLEAPTVDLLATVLEGSDAATLARAAGRIEYTAVPGAPGNVGIAGHRDTVFRPVRHLEVGDPLILTTATHTFSYRVSALTVVDPDQVQVLDPSPLPMLTLVTCYPFDYIGPAPRRFIVSAALVGRAPR